MEDLQLEKAGLETTQGYLQVNSHMQTSISDIYAAGDLTGGWLLAHVASAEGIVAAEHACGLESSIDYRVIPRCTFSMPEYSAVGLTEEEAKKTVRSRPFPFLLKPWVWPRPWVNWKEWLNSSSIRNRRHCRRAYHWRSCQ